MRIPATLQPGRIQSITSVIHFLPSHEYSESQRSCQHIRQDDIEIHRDTYKKHVRKVERAKGGDQEGKSGKRVTESMAPQRKALHCPQTYKTIETRGQKKSSKHSLFAIQLMFDFISA
jgi:hypothetical protein